MRSRWWAVLGSVVLGASLAAGGAGLASASRPAPGTKVSCKFDVTADWTGNHRGQDHGALVCGKPLGRGVEHDSYTAKTTATKAMLTAQIADSFTDGTIRGRLDATRGYLYPGPPSIYTWQYVGSVHFTGGTGAYSHAKGLAIIDCFSQDQGIHMDCSFGAAITGI